MPRTNLYINKVRKWIDTNIEESDLDSLADSEGDKAGRRRVLTIIADRCYKSGVKVNRRTIHKEISSFYMRHKMIKATTPYAETPRNTNGRFMKKDATLGVKVFPARESRDQRNLVSAFLKEYRELMHQAAEAVDEEEWMGSTRTAWLVFADGSEEKLVSRGDKTKIYDLLKFQGDRLSELIKKPVGSVANSFVNFYDSTAAIADTHRDMTTIGSTVMVLELEKTAETILEISLEAPTAKEMDWKEVRLQRGDILALGANVTHRFTGSTAKRAALVCFF
jgi:hypothetical protein